MIACAKACFDMRKCTDGNAWNGIVVNLALALFALERLVNEAESRRLPRLHGYIKTDVTQRRIHKLHNYSRGGDGYD